MPTQERLWLNDKKRLLPGPNRPRQKNQEHPVRFGTGRSFHLSVEDNERLSKERVLCYELGLAPDKVSQCPKPGARWCSVWSSRRSGGRATEDKPWSTA